MNTKLHQVDMFCTVLNMIIREERNGYGRAYRILNGRDPSGTSDPRKLSAEKMIASYAAV